MYYTIHLKNSDDNIDIDRLNDTLDERVNENMMRYYYSGGAILFSTDEEFYLNTENILDLSGSIIASMRFEDQDPQSPDPYADNYYFYNYDMRGSTSAIIKPDGNMVEGYTYDEFGNKTQTEYDSAGNEITDPNNEIFENEVTFTSSITDTSTGLQYIPSFTLGQT